MRWWIAAALAVLVALPAEAGQGFVFGWPTGSAEVRATWDGHIQTESTYEMHVRRIGDGWGIRYDRERFVSASGEGLTRERAQLLSDVSPVLELVLNAKGRAVRVTEIEAAKTPPRLDDEGLQALVDAAAEHQADSATSLLETWNEEVASWVGVNLSPGKALRRTAGDGRSMLLEYVGSVDEPKGFVHRSMRLTGATRDAVRGCDSELLENLRVGLTIKGRSEQEAAEMVNGTRCEEETVTESVVDPRTLRPHLEVEMVTTKLTFPGYEPREQSTVKKWEYTWR